MAARLNRAAVLAIAGRDLRNIARSRAVLVPLLVVPALLLLTPPLTLVIANAAPESLAAELAPLFTRLPADLSDRLPSEPSHRAVVLLLVYVFAPLFLVVPLLVASMTAADAVVGERQRRTLEGLLHTPTTNHELLLGKVLTPWAMAVVMAVLGAVAYGAVANTVLAQYGQPASFPNPVWVVLVVWVSPAAAAFGVGLVVVLSARIKTFQEANQVAGFVVLPIVGLVVAQAAGVLLFDGVALGLLGGALWLLTLLLLRVAGHNFRRDRLLIRD
ncbi:MAG TPA: ABC transporter permease subunit [Euzebyales bacterium]|nr:ABC transporter permease subunit [Euzebyales bacterium]